MCRCQTFLLSITFCSFSIYLPIYICQRLDVFFSSTCYTHFTSPFFLLNVVSIVLRTMIYVSLFYDIETGDICPSMPIAIWEANSAYGNLYSTICPRSIIHIEELNFLCLLYLFQFFLYFNHSTICSIKISHLETLIDLILTTIHFQHFSVFSYPFSLSLL